MLDANHAAGRAPYCSFPWATLSVQAITPQHQQGPHGLHKQAEADSAAAAQCKLVATMGAYQCRCYQCVLLLICMQVTYASRCTCTSSSCCSSDFVTMRMANSSGLLPSRSSSSSAVYDPHEEMDLVPEACPAMVQAGYRDS